MARLTFRFPGVPLAAGFAVLLALAGCTLAPPARERSPAPSLGTPAPLPINPPLGEKPEVIPSLATDAGTGRAEAPGPAVPDTPVVEAPSPVPEVVPAVEMPAAERPGTEGVATYYAKRFNGRPTASGVPYDPASLTAAHQSLPFGTRVKVVNLANGREVEVTVNDRCRKRKFPFIDLSRAAAERLGFLGKGTAKVRIIPLDNEGK